MRAVQLDHGVRQPERLRFDFVTPFDRFQVDVLIRRLVVGVAIEPIGRGDVLGWRDRSVELARCARGVFALSSRLAVFSFGAYALHVVLLHWRMITPRAVSAAPGLF